MGGFRQGFRKRKPGIAFALFVAALLLNGWDMSDEPDLPGIHAKAAAKDYQEEREMAAMELTAMEIAHRMRVQGVGP